MENISCCCCGLFVSFLSGTNNFAIHETHLLKCYFLFFGDALRDLRKKQDSFKKGIPEYYHVQSCVLI